MGLYKTDLPSYLRILALLTILIITKTTALKIIEDGNEAMEIQVNLAEIAEGRENDFIDLITLKEELPSDKENEDKARKGNGLVLRNQLDNNILLLLTINKSLMDKIKNGNSPPKFNSKFTKLTSKHPPITPQEPIINRPILPMRPVQLPNTSPMPANPSLTPSTTPINSVPTSPTPPIQFDSFPNAPIPATFPYGIPIYVQHVPVGL